ncbi:uncharacterized protein METZ01_LOCUS348844 [marine metagenome]|uniref:Uncharacterized protein n=1 Tax=marine metagenome TaxID=408172 RepID=A0A382RF26_9ZZZZ
MPDQYFDVRSTSRPTVYSSKLRSYTGKKAANHQCMHWKSVTSWRCADLLDCVFSPIKVVRTAGLEPVQPAFLQAYVVFIYMHI